MAIGITCVKVIVFVCNLLFALTGVLILTVGAIVQTTYSHYSNFVGDNIWSAPIILIVVGAVVFIIGFLGCCGAIKENSCMILTFSILIVIIFLMEIGIGIAAYIKHGELDTILAREFNKTLDKYNERKDYRDAWKLIQTEMDCCGINGPNDWQSVFHNSTLPASCCSEIPNGNQCTSQYAHQRGCSEKLLSLLNENVSILAAVAITVALVQLLTIIFACCLYRSFSRNYETV